MLKPISETPRRTIDPFKPISKIPRGILLPLALREKTASRLKTNRILSELAQDSEMGCSPVEIPPAGDPRYDGYTFLRALCGLVNPGSIELVNAQVGGRISIIFSRQRMGEFISASVPLDGIGFPMIPTEFTHFDYVDFLLREQRRQQK